MTVREHLAEHHRVAAEHHTKLAKLHHGFAENCAEPEQTFHKEMGDAHLAHAEHHVECCKNCMKAGGADSLDKSTEGASSVNLGADKGRTGITPFPRTGQREVPGREKPQFEDPALQRLVE